MKRQRPTLEPLEPRILYSADTPSALAAALVGMPDAEHRLLDAEGEFAVQNEPAEIVFIDARTPDAAQLVEDIAAQSERQVEVVVLDAERDGLEQINEALAGRENVAALHFIAHGGEGVMQLGNTLVTADALERNPGLVEAWSQVLTADADILLYGCDIAATAQGRLLADTLARLTGADVSASDDATGHASLGGDWDLEFQSGRVETEVVFSEEFRSQWVGLLPTYESFTSFPSELEIKSDANHGQTFAHNSGNGTYTVNQISLALRGDAAAVPQTLTVTLRDGWNGTILGSATISSASLGPSLAFHDLSIGNVTLIDTQVYTIQVTTDTTAGKVYAGFNSAGGYGGGNRIDSNGSPLAGEDVAFKVTANEPPVITSNGGAATASVSAAENLTAVTTVTSSDVDGGVASYSIVGGADAAWFTINPTTGALTFNTAPDFEAPTDVGADNVYDLTVQASDGNGGTDMQNIAVSVLDLGENATRMISGTFTGDGIDDRVITGIGFAPDVVIVFSDASEIPVIRTSTMAADLSKPTAGGTALGANLIQSLGADGFTVGNDARVNANGTSYYWAAFEAGDDMTVGTYVGSGGAQSIAGIGFSPELVFVLPAGSTKAVWHSIADTSSHDFDGGNVSSTQVTSLNADGFSLGTSPDVNSNGAAYHYIAFNEAQGVMDVGTYSGDGVDNRNITGLGFAPEYLIVERLTGTSNDDTRQKTESSGAGTDETFQFDGSNPNANEIQALQADGFQVGTDGSVNANGRVYAYLAWRQVTNEPRVTFGEGDKLFTENDPPVLIDAAVTVADPDSADFDGGTLTVSLTAGGTAHDRLAIQDVGTGAGQIGISGANVMYGGIVIGTFAGGTDGSTPLAVTFNANATQTAAQALLRNVTFENTSNTPVEGARSLQVILTDGDGYASPTVTKTITVDALMPAATLMISGSYTGDGLDNRAIAGLGFTPDVVIVTPDSGGGPAVRIPVIRTSTMAGDVSKNMTGGTTLAANLVQSLDVDGFTIGTDAQVNANGIAYRWVAFKAGDDMVLGAYTGTGSNQSLTDAGFSPELVFVLGESADKAVFRSSVSNATWDFAGGASSTSQITSLDADGFSLGTSGIVNNNGDLYHYIAWNEVAGLFDVGSYTGNDADDRNITGTGLEPEYAIVKRLNAGRDTTHKTESSGAATDKAYYFDGTNGTTNLIQALQPNGFQVGTANQVNNNGDSYAWFAWRQETAPAGADKAVTTAEDTPYAFTVTDFAFSDADPGDSLSAVLIDTLPSAGSLRLSGVAVNAGDLVSASDIAAGNLTFVPAFEASGAPYASFTFKVGDEGVAFDATANTMTVNVTAVNDPVADLNAAGAGQDVTVAFTEQTPALIAPVGTLTDPDSANLTSLTLTLTARPDGNAVESLSLNAAAAAAASGAGLAVSYTAASGVLSIAGSASVATYQTILQGVQYSNTSDTPTASNRSVTVVANDGALSSVAAISTVTVAAVNDAPVANADSYTIAEDTTLDTDALWFDAAWSYRRALSFDNTAQTENLTDFPVLIALDASRIDYAQTQNNGQDLRFTDGDGTLLAHEIETWNESGTSYVWVKVPQVDGGSGSDFIWMYYGNAAAPDGENAPAVWSNNFQAVYHLNDNTGASGSIGDSTGVFNATNVGTTAVGGYIGEAHAFNGINQRVNLGANQPYLNNASGATISAWVNAASTVQEIIFATEVGSPTGFSRATLDLVGNRITLIGRSTDFELGRELQSAPGLISTGTWHYLTGVIDYAGDTLTIYVDGVQVASASGVGFAASATPGTNSARASMGANEDGTTGRYNGVLDEVSLADSVRTADWIAAQYASTSDAFVAYGSEQSSAGVLGNDTDVDSALLTVLVSGPGNAASFSLNADGSFTYVPNANFNGVDSFTYVANDGTADSMVATVTITVTPVNDAPANAMPVAQTTIEDTALVFSTGNGNAISIADVDAAASPVRVTLSGTNGVITLAGTAGLSFSVGDGTADGAMTFTGTVAAINAALDGLSFAPTANFNGAASLSINTSDQGNTGSGGALSDLDAVAITVNAVNDAPVLAAAAPSFTSVTEDQATNVGDSVAALLGASVSDVDAGALEGIAVTGLVSSNGTWQYSINGGASWNAVGAVANNNALLLRDVDRLRFVPDGLNADAGSVSYRAWDRSSGTQGTKVNASVNGGTTAFSTASDTASITVTALNDAPVLAAAAPSFTSVTEDQATNVGDSVAALLGASVSDVDAGALEGIAVTGLVSSNGTWQYSINGGASWNAVGAVANNNALLLRDVDRLRFVPDGLNADAGSVSYRAWDRSSGTQGTKVNASVNGGTTAFSTASDTASITVTAVNDAPTNAMPVAQTTAEDTARVFSVSNGNAISIGDVDAGASPVQVTLSGTNGVITLAGIAGLTFSVGDGSADGAMTFTGTVAAINTALNGMSFAPTANFNGAALLSINTDDQGNAGAGGALSDLDTVAITVNTVNDAPANTVPGAQTTVEDAALVFSVGGGNAISIGDVDAGASPVRVTLSGTNGVITLAGSAGLAFSVGDGSADGAMTFTGTVAAINAALDGLSFAPSANFNGAASLSINTNDQGNAGAGGALSDLDAVAITVNAVNDAPANAMPVTQTTNEDTALVFSAGNGNAISVGDVDAGTSPVQVVLTGANGAITLAGIAGLTFSVGDGVADAAMTFSGTLGAINAALNGLSFMPSANFSGAASLSISTDDQGNTGAGGALSDADAVAITVLPNGAPTVTASGGTTVFTEGGNVASTPVILDGAVTVSDPDSTTLTGATISIGAGWQAAEDVLGFASNPATMGNIAGSYNAATGVLSLSSTGATATLAEWQAALRSLTYTNTSEMPSTAARTVSFVVNGQGGSSAASVQQVAVVAVNDAPTLSASGGTTAFAGGGAAVVVDTALAVSDVDNATLAAATVSIGGGFQPGQDVLDFSSDPATMGNITGSYNAASGVLNLSSAGASATLAQWQAALRSVSYDNTAATPILGVRSVSIAVSDGNSSGPVASHTVIVNPAPVVPEPPAPPPVVPPVIPPVVVGLPPVTPPPAPAPQPAPSTAPGRPSAAVAEESGETSTLVADMNATAAPASVGQHSTPAADAGVPATRVVSFVAAQSVLAAEAESELLAGVLVRQADARPMNLFQLDERGRTAAEEGLGSELAQLRESLREQDEIQQRTVVTLAAGSLSMTLAYLLWLIRGGALVASALSALPAWRLLDPLPILSRVDDEDEEEAGEDEDQAIASFADEPVGTRR